MPGARPRPIDVREGGLDDPRVRALIAHHRTEAAAATPICNAHSLDVAGLDDPAVTFLSAWSDDTLLGIAALRELDPAHGEVKSMRTAPDHVRQGVGRALLDRLVLLARSRGYARLSLETGTAPMFAAANAMYERAGFADCAPFGGYPPSTHNRFMAMELR